jgi:hypothetical protein
MGKGAPDLHPDGPWPAKDVEVPMHSEPLMRDPATLVVPRHHEDRHPGRRHLRQGPEGIVGKGRKHPGAVEEIAAMDHHCHLPIPGRLRGRLEARPQVVASEPPLGPGWKGHIESQVGVGQEEDPDGSLGGRHGITGSGE